MACGVLLCGFMVFDGCFGWFVGHCYRASGVLWAVFVVCYFVVAVVS